MKKSLVQQLIGKKILTIKPVSSQLQQDMGWDEMGSTYAVEIFLEGGISIIAYSDEEGNSPGVFNVWDSTAGEKILFVKDGEVMSS